MTRKATKHDVFQIAERRHPAQAGQPGASQQLMQDRLRLIVGRVRDGHGGAVIVGGHATEKVIPAAAARFLNADAPLCRERSDVASLDDRGQAKRLGQSPDPYRILGRLGPQIMIQMSDDHSHRRVPSQQRQPSQECHAVRPARHTGDHTSP